MSPPASLIPPLTAPLERRRFVDRAWLRFVEDGVEPEGLPAEIARSWRRARETFGVDPTQRRAPRALRAEELEERRRRDPIFRLAAPILEDFALRLGAVEHVLTYFDAAGWMLAALGHPRVLAGVAEINFAPGANWAEESVGTNGPGTAIREGKPLEVFASEHFVEAWQRWTCAGAPIFAPGGDLPVGLVDITGPWEAHGPQVIVAARAIARTIEERLRAAQAVRDEVIRFSFQAARSSGDALVAIDTGGRILAANGPASSRIGLEAGRLPPDLRRTVEDALLGGASPGEGETVHAWRDLRVVAIPVLHEGCPIGAMLRAVPAVDPGPARARAAAGPRAAAPVRYGFEQILGGSGALLRAVELARLAARNALPVVLSGESGTGKELFAQSIHGASLRAGGHFVAVNCGSIPASLVESELFGYEAGAFTGGRREGSSGRFEDASGGTLFLDEVSELSLQAQTALLRVLQEREVVRLGGSEARRVDVRIVAASNKGLRAEVAAGRFREDLFYRLDVLSIAIPPLRQRIEDIPVLAEAFLEEAEAAVGRSGLRLADDAIAALQACPWPGNVRQLRNAMLRVAATAPGTEIRGADLPAEVRRAASEAPPPAAAPAAIARAPGAEEASPPATAGLAEGAALREALDGCGWNVARAAARLGVSRMTLYRRMERLGVARPGRA